MMRLVSLCLVLFTVACGPAHESRSDLFGSNSSAKSFNKIDLNEPVVESEDYPIAPDPSLTPGLRCVRPDEHRYPEQIAYCERAVSKSVKDRVIHSYDQQLGYHLEDLDRSKIKIDHYIPLCMGGDNNKSNLWPQHEIVYSHTDPLEERLCLALSRGLITQDESIDQMLYAKAHLNEASEMLAKIQEIL